jgi:hypothetical protein
MLLNIVAATFGCYKNGPKNCRPHLIFRRQPDPRPLLDLVQAIPGRPEVEVQEHPRSDLPHALQKPQTGKRFFPKLFKFG